MTGRQVLLKLVAVGMLICMPTVFAVKYMSKNEFVSIALSETDNQHESKSLWLDDELQTKIKTILGHRYPKLRLRYIQTKEAGQTLWFLEEIGKERPISFGISIIDQRVALIKVMDFRESRGGEIRMLSFTEQFNNIGIKADSKLDQHIDGITGATMSVSAMKKITRLALMLDAEVKLRLIKKDK